MHFANALAFLSKFEDAENNFDAAIAHLQNAIQEHPDVIDFHKALGICLHQHANFLAICSKYQQALSQYQQVITIFLDCLNSDSADMSLLHLQSLVLSDLGALQTDLSEYEAATESFERYWISLQRC